MLRLDSKRAIDFWLGRPLLSLLQVAARVLGMVLRRPHGIEPVRRVVFAKFQGLGSLVMCKPALAAVRRARPDAELVFWGTPALAVLAREMPEFDRVLVLDDRSMVTAFVSTARALLTLWRQPLDWALDLEVYSRLSSVLITASCARNRAGFALEQLRSRRVHSHLVYFNRYRYVGDAYQRLIGLLLPAGQQPGDPPPANVWRFPNDPLPSTDDPYIVLNVHAGDLALERRWPLERFRQLALSLLERLPGHRVVLIGRGEAEGRYLDGFLDHPRVSSLANQLTLPETIRLLSHARLVVTNDSGPLHLALLGSSPVVALFGPTRSGSYLPPERAHTVAVQEPIYCSPCVHHWEPPPCGGNNQCMQRIQVDRVVSACLRAMGEPVEEAVAMPAVPPETGDYYPGLVYSRTGGRDA